MQPHLGEQVVPGCPACPATYWPPLPLLHSTPPGCPPTRSAQTPSGHMNITCDPPHTCSTGAGPACACYNSTWIHWCAPPWMTLFLPPCAAGVWSTIIVILTPCGMMNADQLYFGSIGINDLTPLGDNLRGVPHLCLIPCFMRSASSSGLAMACKAGWVSSSMPPHQQAVLMMRDGWVLNKRWLCKDIKDEN